MFKLYAQTLLVYFFNAIKFSYNVQQCSYNYFREICNYYCMVNFQSLFTTIKFQIKLIYNSTIGLERAQTIIRHVFFSLLEIFFINFTTIQYAEYWIILATTFYVLWNYLFHLLFFWSQVDDLKTANLQVSHFGLMLHCLLPELWKVSFFTQIKSFQLPPSFSFNQYSILY